jgi:hypothetical protein
VLSMRCCKVLLRTVRNDEISAETIDDVSETTLSKFYTFFNFKLYIINWWNDTFKLMWQ